MAEIGYNKAIQYAMLYSPPIGAHHSDWIRDELYPEGESKMAGDAGYAGNSLANMARAEADRPRPDRPRNVEAVSPKFNINVFPLDHGFLVEVGCKRVAIESAERLCRVLERYLKWPELTTEQFMRGGLSAIKEPEKAPAKEAPKKQPPKDGRRKH